MFSLNLPPLLTIDQVADEAELSRATLYRRFQKYGEPPSVREGKRVLYPRDEALAWIEQHVLGEDCSDACERERKAKARLRAKYGYTSSEVLPIKRVLKILKVCRATLYNHFRRYGRPKTIRAQKRLYFVKVDFDAWVKQLPTAITP